MTVTEFVTTACEFVATFSEFVATDSEFAQTIKRSRQPVAGFFLALPQLLLMSALKHQAKST